MDDHMAERVLEQLGLIEAAIYEPKIPTPRVFLHKENDLWCAKHGDVAGYGKSPSLAQEAYITAWYICIDTTCNRYRCSKCTKARETEKALEAKNGA